MSELNQSEQELNFDDSCSESCASNGISKSKLNDMIRIHETVVLSGKPNFQHCRIPVNSRLNIQFFRSSLQGYPDSEIVDLLEFGAPIGIVDREVSNSRCRNHNGAKSFPVEMQQYFDKEVQEGAMVGPFQVNPLTSMLNFSPLSSREKCDSVERRVIVDLSFPPGNSVNDSIPKNAYSGKSVKLTYPSVNSLVALIKSRGKGCALYKRDLRRAYRQFPVDPRDINFLAYSWNHRIYIDVALPMGLCSSAYICQRITNAVAYILRCHGFEAMMILLGRRNGHKLI